MMLPIIQAKAYFPSWVYKEFSKGKEIAIENGIEEDKRIVRKMIIVGLWRIVEGMEQFRNLPWLPPSDSSNSLTFVVNRH